MGNPYYYSVKNFFVPPAFQKKKKIGNIYKISSTHVPHRAMGGSPGDVSEEPVT